MAFDNELSAIRRDAMAQQAYNHEMDVGHRNLLQGRLGGFIDPGPLLGYRSVLDQDKDCVQPQESIKLKSTYEQELQAEIDAWLK